MAGRPRKLTPAIAEAIVFNTEIGVSLEAAARLSGVAPRSLRRWLEQGRDELNALSPEAKLVLALDRAERKGAGLSWEQAAAQLEALAPERWACSAAGEPLVDPPYDPLDDAQVAQRGRSAAGL